MEDVLAETVPHRATVRCPQTVWFLSECPWLSCLKCDHLGAEKTGAVFPVTLLWFCEQDSLCAPLPVDPPGPRVTFPPDAGDPGPESLREHRGEESAGQRPGLSGEAWHLFRSFLLPGLPKWVPRAN